MLSGRNTLHPHDANYAPGLQVCLLSLVSLMRLGFLFNSCTDDLDILYGGNVFDNAALKNDFIVPDLDVVIIIHLLPVSFSDPNSKCVKWHARLRRIG